MKDEKIKKPLNIAMLGDGVILGTKIKRLQGDTYLEKMVTFKKVYPHSFALLKWDKLI